MTEFSFFLAFILNIKTTLKIEFGPRLFTQPINAQLI